MTKDKSWKSFLKFCYILGGICLLLAIYIHIEGIPRFNNIEEQSKFCYNENGRFIKPERSNYNTALCSFAYNGEYSNYAIDKITNKEWANAFNKTLGDYCLICFDSGSCERDVLTKIDNGVRRGTRC